ncbi:MAG: gliding motility lipoprotein GldB [Cryomorphaceae bacterium BACL21 MAG-121220-bin10]|nr:MAG: gliding motility lipoprotein GldB [Cryomorphaceae bacterium BACL21 MAG-121220-bin10]
MIEMKYTKQVIIKQVVFALGLSFLLMGCDQKSKQEKRIDELPISIQVQRFDRAFAEAEVADLDDLKQQYPLFFPTQYPDSIWRAKLVDTLQNELDYEVGRVFADDLSLNESISDLFRHISFYAPGFEVPTVVTTTSDVDYRTRVIANRRWLILMLDVYLGSDHKFYQGIPLYIVKNLRPEMIVSDVATAYARKMVAVPQGRAFLAQIIYYGKVLYLKDLWLPEVDDADKIGYTPQELLWAEDNEIDVWQYFVSREYLYSTNSKLTSRFIDPAPFSKFELELDQESPGMIGQWLGWQIVRSYMNNNSSTVEQLMALPAEEIFNQSLYKPNK